MHKRNPIFFLGTMALLLALLPTRYTKATTSSDNWVIEVAKRKTLNKSSYVYEDVDVPIDEETFITIKDDLLKREGNVTFQKGSLAKDLNEEPWNDLQDPVKISHFVIRISYKQISENSIVLFFKSKGKIETRKNTQWLQYIEILNKIYTNPIDQNSISFKGKDRTLTISSEGGKRALQATYSYEKGIQLENIEVMESMPVLKPMTSNTNTEKMLTDSDNEDFEDDDQSNPKPKLLQRIVGLVAIAAIIIALIYFIWYRKGKK